MQSPDFAEQEISVTRPFCGCFNPVFPAGNRVEPDTEPGAAALIPGELIQAGRT
jgi:hypothetical protein